MVYLIILLMYFSIFHSGNTDWLYYYQFIIAVRFKQSLYFSRFVTSQNPLNFLKITEECKHLKVSVFRLGWKSNSSNQKKKKILKLRINFIWMSNVDSLNWIIIRGFGSEFQVISIDLFFFSLIIFIKRFHYIFSPFDNISDYISFKV